MKKPIPTEAIGTILYEVTELAVKNGANSVSMPPEYVAVAHFLAYPEEYGQQDPALKICRQCHTVNQGDAEVCDCCGKADLIEEGASATYSEEYGQQDPAGYGDIISTGGMDPRNKLDHEAAELQTILTDRYSDYRPASPAGLFAWACAALRDQPPDAGKAVYWFSVLVKCARLLDLPTDEPIPAGVLAAVERLTLEPAATLIRPGMDLRHLSSAQLVQLQKELQEEERSR